MHVCVNVNVNACACACGPLTSGARPATPKNHPVSQPGAVAYLIAVSSTDTGCPTISVLMAMCGSALPNHTVRGCSPPISTL